MVSSLCVNLLDQDGCQILAVLQDAAGSKKILCRGIVERDGQQSKPVTLNIQQVTAHGSTPRHL